MTKIRKMMVATMAAAALAVPLTPAAAHATPGSDNCFIHTDDWVACVCNPAARLLTTLTGEGWSCA